MSGMKQMVSSDLALEGEYSYATDVEQRWSCDRSLCGRLWSNDYAFVYSEEFGRQRLFSLIENPSGWLSLESATHINDRGQIAGIGRFGYGNRRIYLATPIPEPELATLLGAWRFC